MPKLTTTYRSNSISSQLR